MTRYLTIPFIFGTIFATNGQTLQFRQWDPSDTSYSVPQPFPVDAVADDFGPRRHPQHNFHRGIDYNCVQDDGNADKWNLILAPEDGIVVQAAQRLWTPVFSYKQLCYQAGDHRYIFGHVYDNAGQNYIENHGTIVLKGMLFPDHEFWAQIFIVNGDTVVLGQIDGGLVEYNGDTLVATNQITAGMPIAPLGDANIPGAAHLHLNTIPITEAYSTPVTTYASNPLQYIEYTKADYDMSLYCQADNQTFVPVYSSTGQVVSPMALKLGMQTNVSGDGNKRYDHIFDVDKVRFYQRRAGEQDFQMIQGRTVMSEIILGGRLGETKLNHPNPSFGSWNVTGVDSRAYNSGYPNQPYDIYHYSDFVTRIHKNHVMGSQIQVAHCPQNARYIDGRYELLGRVTDIRNGIFDGDMVEFTLDNFKPFVQKVEIYIDDQAIKIYEEEWTCTGDCIRFSDNNLNTTVNLSDISAGFWVYVTTSEQMEALTLSVPALQIQDMAPDAGQSANNGIDYVFIIDAATLDNLGYEMILHFSGTDKGGNELISFTTQQASQCLSVPVRQSATTWSDPNTPDLTYGADMLHRFALGCAPRMMNGTMVNIESYELDLSADIMHAFSQTCRDGAIDLHIGGGLQDYTLQWSRNGSPYGAQVVTTGSDGLEDLHHITPGTYKVEINDALCGSGTAQFVVSLQSHIVTLEAIQGNTFCTDYSGRPYYGASGDGYIHIDVDLAGSYSLSWTGPNGFSSVQEDINMLCPGIYNLHITNAQGCMRTWNYEICCCSGEVDAQGGTSYACSNLPGYAPLCSESVYDMLMILEGEWASPQSGSDCDGFILPHVTGGNGAVAYQWTLPAGGSSSAKQLVDLCPGEYCLTVNDGCSTASRCWDLVDCSASGLSVYGTTLPTCHGYSVGSAVAVVNGGASPYRYVWSNGQNGATIQNLTAGSYSITVTDKNKCTAVTSLAVQSIETQTIRNNCSFYVFCNGFQVNQYSIGSYQNVNPADCRYYDTFCNDGYHVGSTYVGTYFNYLGNCVLGEYCKLTNQLYDIHYGTTETISYGIQGYDSNNNCWWCHDVTICDFGELGYIILGVTTHVAILMDYFSPHCPEGYCYLKVICGSAWEVLYSGCLYDCGGHRPCGFSDLGLVYREIQTDVRGIEDETWLQFEVIDFDSLAVLNYLIDQGILGTGAKLVKLHSSNNLPLTNSESMHAPKPLDTNAGCYVKASLNNPVYDHTRFLLNTTKHQTVIIHIYDASMRVVATDIVTVYPGDTFVNIPLDHLYSGIYFYRCYFSECKSVETGRFLKINN